MIKTFASKATEELFTAGRSRKLNADIWATGLRRLREVHSANTLADLRGSGRKLETNRDGRHVIRVNDRYRLLFRWVNGDAYDVEILDYH